MGNAVRVSPGTDRLHALDAVRGGALLLGVVFHATLSFMEPRIWAVGDETSAPLTVLFFVLHIFRMTVFFVLAGFFARLLLERRGVRGFVKNRTTRILVPLLSFWPIVFTAIISVFLWSAMDAAGGALPADAPPPPPLTAQNFPLTHLWFLYVLLWLYAGALVLRGASRLIDRGGAMGRVLDACVRFIVRWRLEAAVFGAPVILALWLKPDWYMWFGVPTPDTGVVPNTPALIAYSGAFALGWLLNRQIDLLQTWRKTFPWALVFAIASTLACLAIAGLTPTLAPAAQDMNKVAFASLYVISIWSWTTGLIGAALQFLSGHSAVRRYVSDASYWIYIVHLPLVMAGQMLVLHLALPALVKFAMIVAGTLLVSFATYHVLVRYSFIGAILNGPRNKLAKRMQSQTALAAAE